MSETAEILKRALMFQLKNPDGSVNWMMSVFIWVLLLLILFALIYVPMVAAKKNKFGNPPAADEPLTIYFKSGLTQWEEVYNSQTQDFILNKLAPITAKSTNPNVIYKAVGLRFEEVRTTTADGFVSRPRLDIDANLGKNIQIVYSSGLTSLFGNMASGTVLANLTTDNSGIYTQDMSILDMYTDPKVVWLTMMHYATMPTAQVEALKNSLEALKNDNTKFKVTLEKYSANANVGRMVMVMITGGGRLEPELPGRPWFDQFDSARLPMAVIPLSNLSTTVTDFTAAQKQQLFDAAIKARSLKRPDPTFETMYLIEAPPSQLDVANEVATYLKNVKHFTPYESTVVKVETSTTATEMNILLVSMKNSLGITWKAVTMPVLLTTVPAGIRVTTNQINSAVTSSVKFYNELAKALEQKTPKQFGPTVIRIEGDMDPEYVRSRLEQMNYNGGIDSVLTMIVKYVQNKNKNRPRGTLFVYLESYDKNLLSKFPPDVQAMAARLPTGSFLGSMKAHSLINGPDMANAGPNPLLASEQLLSETFDPIINFVQTGKGALPREEDVVDALGCPIRDPCPPEKICPTPEPCPSCPPEKVCPTPEPCPSCPPEKVCPTFDVATMCPKPDPCPTFDIATMCPSKPIWPPTSAVASTAKNFKIYYRSSQTSAALMNALLEALRMRITFADKPMPNLAAVTSTSTTYKINDVGVEVIDPTTKRKVVTKINVADVRQGVENIYATLAPYL